MGGIEFFGNLESARCYSDAEIMKGGVSRSARNLRMELSNYYLGILIQPWRTRYYGNIELNVIDNEITHTRKLCTEFKNMGPI